MKALQNMFDTSNYDLEKLLSKGKKNKKVIDSMKYYLDGKIMKELLGLRAKTCSYLTADNDESKHVKCKKICYKEKS